MRKSPGVPGMWSVPLFLVLGGWGARAQSSDKASAPPVSQPPFQLKVNSNLVVVDSQRELASQDVLAEVAQDTGGRFFHNNNDLKAGFGALAGSPVDYVLAFAPSDMKPDGKFHTLKVKLAEKHKNFDVQARR